MLTSLYYGYWDYWELDHQVTFDGTNKLILINDGTTDLDVQSDIYSAWKEWLALEQNTKYLKAIDTVGGEPTVGTERLDVTYFLINGWKIKPFPGSYTLNIVGNLFDVDGGDVKVPADVIKDEPNNITVNLNTSVIVRQVSTTDGGGVSPEISGSIYIIENTVLDIQNTLSQPLESTLVGAQALQLNNIETTTLDTNLKLLDLTDINISQSLMIIDLQTKLHEVWQLHGLDITSPLTVTQTERLFGDVDQTINTIGSGSTQETTITRNP